MTEPAVEDPQAARHEAEVAALEAAVAAAVTAGLAAHLASISSALRDAARDALTNPVRWLTARRQAARALRATRPDIARHVEAFLPRAAELGARHAGAPLPTGHDPAADPIVRQSLADLDRTVRRKLDGAAAAVEEGPALTPVKPLLNPGAPSRPSTAPVRLEETLAKVDSPAAAADAAVGDVVARVVAGGTVAAAEMAGIRLVWWSERTSCNNCKSMAGAVAEPGGRFHRVRRFAARQLPWMAGGVDAPPLHKSCRCRAVPETPGLADALQREAEREVARGESKFDSLPARLAAVGRLLEGGSRLPKTVQARAARDLEAGKFSQRGRKAG